MRPSSRALIVLLIVTTLARCVFAGLLDLGQDEAYAFAVSHPFQLSFFDHPPLSFWIAGAMRMLFGDGISPLLLRLPFLLMFTGSTWALFALTSQFYGEQAGLWAAALFNLAPFFFASAGGWVVPDGPLTLFLLLGAAFLVRALFDPPEFSGHWPDWLAAGLCFGLALLSKYQAVLVLFGALIYVLASSKRAWLARPQPYVAAALALLIASPVLWWNATNGWISFGFQAGRSTSSYGFGGTRLLQLLVGEAVYLQPWIAIGLVVSLVSVWRRGGEWRLLPVLSLPPILLFNLIPLIGPAGLPHWSMAGWLFLFPPLGDALARARAMGRNWPLVFGGVSLLATLALAVFVVAVGSNYRIVSGDPGLNHYLAEATSWTGVADGLRDKGLLDRPNTFYAALNWQDGARLAEAVRPADPVVVFGPDPRGFAFIANPAGRLGEDALIVVRAEDTASATRFAAKYFDAVDTVGTFTTTKGGTLAFSNAVLLAHRLNALPPRPYGPE
jgi:4-amino-4-deoxy-L-arabinose transferase-like glycosyltransferase